MKKTMLITAVLSCLVITCFAMAASINGKWTGTLLSGGGEEFPISYSFKADGNSLTGTGSSPSGDIPITEGKINGSEFSFTVLYNGTTIKNSGKFYAEADSIGLNVDFNGSKMHATLKRADK